MNEIIKKLQIPGYETKLIIVPRKNKSVIAEKVFTGIQLSLDIEVESSKQVTEK
ncbi:hypothetical protein [Neobacillus kokaensis]|uniref:Uncharacterized protein n=1 Tax=Neobacillus kokaensis TaxID=2759023 RepID=A0ABQ3N695_9BACI|nr:hypothetical protein [Neobacillus kokaensis]GHH99709.1 hypothetical protein AM1BK_32520 [Neobacillus kokaensis]